MTSSRLSSLSVDLPTNDEDSHILTLCCCISLSYRAFLYAVVVDMAARVPAFSMRAIFGHLCDM
jgi:hypothetical protein